MAKWGEGDPRWICEERADAKNVNNWHWTEKNAASWSRTKLKELLVGLIVENDEFSVKFKTITKCEGEASANNRKSKLIFFYEWVIHGEWEAVCKNSDNKTTYKGTYEVNNLSEEYKANEIDVDFVMKDGRNDALKNFVRVTGQTKMREQFEKYITALKEEFSQGIILPTAGVAVKDTKPSPVSAPKPVETVATKNKDPAIETNGVGVKIPTTSLNMTEEFKCRVNDIYNCFIEIPMVRAWTQNAIDKYEPEKDGKFSLFSGNIQGTFMQFTPNKQIIMNWRNKMWPEGHFSIVTLEFTEKSDCSEVKLKHLAIPKVFAENTEEGWRRFYWNAIKQTFGYGAGLI